MAVARLAASGPFQEGISWASPHEPQPRHCIGRDVGLRHVTLILLQATRLRDRARSVQAKLLSGVLSDAFP